MSRTYRIAGIQTDIQYGRVHENLEMAGRHIRQLANQDVFLAVFPECSLTGYCCQSLEEGLSIAVEREGPVIESAAALARQNKMHVVIGFLERDGANLFNTAALLVAGGDRHFYRKVHLPKIGADQFTTGGCDYPIFELDGLRVGLNICYDCSFPEPARVMALRGVDLIVLPTNWPPGANTTADYIPNARALENNIYYAAINRVGDERGFHFIGKSRICHPDGHSLCEANHDREAVLIAEIDPMVARNKHLVRVPGKHEIHRFNDRRPETYSTIMNR
jgi:5-aminopentanamidase